MTKLAAHHVTLLDSLRDRAHTAPVSELLLGLVRLAKAAGRDDIFRWAKLECDGYHSGNPLAAKDDVVPEYRTVAGRYFDQFGRMLNIRDPKISIINSHRVEWSTAEIERMAQSKDDLIQLHNPWANDLIRQYLKVEVHSLRLSPASLVGVLAAIRSRAIDYLDELDDAIEPVRTKFPPTGEAKRSAFRDHLMQVLVSVLALIIGTYIVFKFGWLK